MHAGESAINKGLANRLAELEVEREERDRAELEEECGIEADTYEALPDPTEDATEGLRHDVNNLTHFVDRLSIRCEDFFRRNAGLEEARKREMHDEERRARLACVDALQALRDGVGAARGVEGVTGPELETLDGVCRRTLASLPTREKILQDRAPGVLKPSALLRVRMAAAALDKVMDATLEEPFARPGALNHARRAAHRLEDADFDAYSTWHAPLANALDAACALLDRHASASSTSLDVVRLMKRRRRAPEDEHPCSTDEALDEWGRRLDAGKVPDARQWRVVATLSNEDAPEETQEDNWGGSWDERPWTSDPEDIGPVKKDLDLVKAKAELTQRTCLRLDAALEEVVAQMRGGFASKADLQEVEEHLRRLASIQRGTANEIASNKAGLSDYELQLKRVADQVRASQAKRRASSGSTQAHLAQGRRRGRRARHDGDSGTGRRRRVEGRGVRRAGTDRRGRRRHLLDEVFGLQPALPVSSETGDPGSASTAESGGHAAVVDRGLGCGRDARARRSKAGPHFDASSTATGRRLRAGHGGARRVPGDAATETKDEAEGRDQRAGRAARRAALVRFAGFRVGVI